MPGGIVAASASASTRAQVPDKTHVVTWQLKYGPVKYKNYYLQIANSGRSNGNWANIAKGNGSRNQKWDSIDVGISSNGEEYAFKNLNSGKCLMGTAHHTEQWTCGKYASNVRWWELYNGKPLYAYELDNVWVSSRYGLGDSCEAPNGSTWVVFANVEAGSCYWH
jgi:Ricin-type beta-trefoil lectin domain-like